LTSIYGEMGRVGGQREHGVNVDANKWREDWRSLEASGEHGIKG
jgi:hypothetical protein